MSYPVAFQYTTFGVTASVTDGDYAPTSPVGIPSPSVFFPPFQTVVHAPVTVYGDVKVEADETFWALPFNIFGATGSDDSPGMGTILNDDVAIPVPTLSKWALFALAGLLSVVSALKTTLR